MERTVHEDCLEIGMPLSKILVPVDFSELSAQTTQFGLALAERHRAALILLHVDELPPYSGPMAARVRPDVWDGYLHERTRVLRERFRSFAGPLPAESDQFETHIVRGDAADEIVRATTPPPPDLVIVAPSGAGSGGAFLVGSVAVRVAADSSCPVLVLRQGSADRQDTAIFRRPLVLLSNTQLDSALVGLVSDLAAPGTDVDLLWAEMGSGDDLQQLPGWAGYARERDLAQRERVRAGIAAVTRLGFKAHGKTASGDLASVALADQTADDNDLIVVSKPIQTVDHRAASAATRLVHHAPVPVLVVRTTTAVQ